MLKKLLSVAAALCILCIGSVSAQIIVYDNTLNDPGFQLLAYDISGVDVTYSMAGFSLDNLEIDGQLMKQVSLPGVIIPNDAGAPNLPGMGRYIAIPQGARASVEIVEMITETFTNVEIAPAPPLPLDTDDSPLVYVKNPAIYNTNAYYPAEPVKLSEKTDIRGVDVVTLGITPFQYNPVTKELLVYRDLVIRVNYIGGNGHFGENRLRSRLFEPVLQGNILNYGQLPPVTPIDYTQASDETNVEYLIIVPDDPIFIAWADTIKTWRKQQGIITGITTLTEIGGNNATLIENYINNAYNTWTIPPAAFLILSDYQSSGDVYGVTAPTWNSYCASDNIYADVNANNLPDMIHARITAQSNGQLSMMINKFLSYERTPPTDPDFYQHPITAGGWQTDRWFILCAEVCRGFMDNILGKDPVREYAIYSGTPGTVWSSNQNTNMVVSYFGPSGLGYIPQTPQGLTDWGGNAARINADINDGAFLMLHRDHGAETGWGEPAYNINSLSGLNNANLPFVFSINCLTGKYNSGSQVFTEAFHRMNHGALGLIAASEVSYSFVNDAYVWGIWDAMWPNFDPGYGPNLIGSTNLQPAYANVAGKYYLAASSWPYNTGDKTVTYHLFHHHGDAFITMYTQVPQALTVVHNGALLGGANQFAVTANSGAVIALTVNNNIIGTAIATGAPVALSIPPQTPGSTMRVTVTLQNYYRYIQDVPVVPPSGPYVIAADCEIADASGWNPNSALDYGETVNLTLSMQNIGVENAPNVNVTISCADPLLTILDNNASFGTINAGATVVSVEGFQVRCGENVENGHQFIVSASAVSGANQWQSSFVLTANAPDVQYSRLEVDDPLGNNNNWLDPGETASLIVFVTNDGDCRVNNLTGTISTVDPYLTINTANASFGNILPGQTGSAVFTVTASISTPMEHVCEIALAAAGAYSYGNEMEFGVMVGNILNAPSGPDAYGYSAYDPFDLPEMPVYSWTEISSDSGGPGTRVNFTSDDQVFQFLLPFEFRFYGVDFDSVSIGANGWVGMGYQTQDDYSNSAIPNPDGPSAMLAAYWEDLSPQRTNSGGVWRYFDSVNHRYIIEYNHIEQFAPVGNFETFQIILFDPAHYPSITGDGRIKFQYKSMSASLGTEGTIGIENLGETIGLQYLFDGNYETHAHPIANQTCILFTTPVSAPGMTVTLTPVNPPIIIPIGGGTFSFLVQITNNGTGPQTFDAWTEAVLPNGSTYGPILLRTGLTLPGGGALNRTLNQNVPGSAPAGAYTLCCKTGLYPATVYASDDFPFTKAGVDASAAGEWFCLGWDAFITEVVPADYFLAQNAPNPFNPTTAISFGLSQSGHTELQVFDLLGRQVMELHNGYLQAGNYTFEFDASQLSSGVYFYTLNSGDFTASKKMLLVK